jgi:phage shock protein A
MSLLEQQAWNAVSEQLRQVKAELAKWKRSHKSLRRKLRNSLAEEKRLRTHGGSDL